MFGVNASKTSLPVLKDAAQQIEKSLEIVGALKVRNEVDSDDNGIDVAAV